MPTLEESTIEDLSKELIAQLKAPLDKRDADLCEKLSKQLDEKIEARLKEEERKRAEFAVPGLTKEDTQKFSFGKLIKGMVTRDFSDCEYEVDLCKEAARQKDMVAGTDSAGGFIVPSQVLADQIIPLLQAQSIAFQLGVRQLTGLTGSPVLIPKVTGATTAYWVGEAPAAGVATSDMAFGQLEMRPRTLAATTKLSNRLITLSTPAADQMVQQQLRKDVGLALDLAVFNGSGVSNQPTGILQTTGINTITSATSIAADTGYDNLIDMIYEVDQDNALMGTLGWAMTPLVLRNAQKNLDKAAQPKERRLFDSMPINSTLLGYKFATSTQFPANTLLFGDFSSCIVGFWTSMMLKISDVAGTNFERLQTQVLIAMDVDIAITQPTAFCAWTDMTGAP